MTDRLDTKELQELPLNTAQTSQEPEPPANDVWISEGNESQNGLESLSLPIGRSQRGWMIGLAVHLCAALAALGTQAGFWAVILWPVLALSFRQQVRYSYWRTATDAIRAVRYKDGRWQLYRAGRWTRAEPVTCGPVSPWLVAVLFRPENGQRPCRLVVFADAVCKERFRQLRVILITLNP